MAVALPFVRELPTGKLAIAAGVGAGTVAAAILDARMGWTRSFRRSQDWLYMGIWGVGLYEASKGRVGDVAETAMIATTPLLTRSLIGIVMPEIARRVGGRHAVQEAERIILGSRTGIVPGQVPLSTPQELRRQKFI